jgi:transcriptional regulator with XRE-family HTH domain
MKKPTRRIRKASFPRMRQIREALGWEIIDIVRRLPTDKPSAATLYRLEHGQAIRVANARRVFDVLNAALKGKLDPDRELVVKDERKP